MTEPEPAEDACDLSISRFIAAPPQRIWAAWTQPRQLERWWIPAPMECQVVELQVRPGGGFVTRMREAGSSDFVPHLDACFLAVEPECRLIWTTCLKGGWRPAKPWLALTATITLTPEAGGTRYDAHVMHDSAAERARHESLGFHAGWGGVIDQLDAMLRDAAR